jgi:hypothetical protein
MSNGLSGLVLVDSATIMCQNCKRNVLTWSNGVGYSLMDGTYIQAGIKRGRIFIDCPSCKKEVYLRSTTRMRVS